MQTVSILNHNTLTTIPEDLRKELESFGYTTIVLDIGSDVTPGTVTLTTSNVPVGEPYEGSTTYIDPLTYTPWLIKGLLTKTEQYMVRAESIDKETIVIRLVNRLPYIAVIREDSRENLEDTTDIDVIATKLAAV